MLPLSIVTLSSEGSFAAPLTDFSIDLSNPTPTALELGLYEEDNIIYGKAELNYQVDHRDTLIIGVDFYKVGVIEPIAEVYTEARADRSTPDFSIKAIARSKSVTTKLHCYN